MLMASLAARHHAENGSDSHRVMGLFIGEEIRAPGRHTGAQTSLAINPSGGSSWQAQDHVEPTAAA